MKIMSKTFDNLIITDNIVRIYDKTGKRSSVK